MEIISEYTIYCTEDQIKKALKLGAPIDNSCDSFDSDCIDNILFIDKELYAVVPTAEQMMGWLEEQGILIIVDIPISSWRFDIYNDGNSWVEGFGEYDSRKEATIAAISAALEYLISKK